MRHPALLVAILALFTALFALSSKNDAPGKKEELAVYMGRIQRYHQKLRAAGEAGNAELAAFYLHEIGEVMEEVVEADIEEDGVRISPHMRSYGLSAVEAMERLLRNEGVASMHASSGLLAEACNACHAATGHAFIRIRIPEHVLFPDQDFSPAEAPPSDHQPSFP